MPNTFDPAEFGLDTEDYWKQYAAKKSGGASFRAPPPRSAWRVLVDSIHDAMSDAGNGLNAAFIRGNEAERENDLIRSDIQTRGGTPAQAEAIIRQNQLQRAAAINERRAQKAILEADENRRRSGAGKVAAKAADIAGSVIGDINPTYAIPAVGSTALARIIGMGGITGASDLAGQGDEVRRDIRDHIDPTEVLVSTGAGMVLQGAGEAVAKGVGKAAGAYKIRSGAKMDNYNDLLDTVISNEGGGTLAHPKTSPKGAMGVMQVRPETAKKPGFGIRPWNGKTQEDLARVGRQYLAALNHEFQGNEDMVLAAYNGGPNRVKSYVVRYGENWLDHMPSETQRYVRDGLRKLGRDVHLVRDEQPSVSDQANANEALAPPSDELEQVLPPRLTHADIEGMLTPESKARIDETLRNADPRDVEALGFSKPEGVAEVHDIADARRARDYTMASNQIDELYDKIHLINQNVVDNEVPLSPNQIAGFENVRSDINKELNNYEPGTPEHSKLLEIDDMLKEAVGYSGGKPRHYAPEATEKVMSGEPKTDAANLNDNRFVGPLPKKGLAAAVKTNEGRVFVAPEGGGHIDIEFIGKTHPGEHAVDDGGFVTPDGTYLDRVQAREYAKSQGFATGEYDDGLNLDAIDYGKHLEGRDLYNEDGSINTDELIRAVKNAEPVERDTNPPATMGQSGPPKRPNFRANKPENELKAEEGHGDERDYPEIKTSKKLILDKLGDALEQGKPLRREAEEAMSIERKRRLAAAMKARSQKGGEEGFLSELAALKGELGRPKIQSIRHWFTPGEIDQLYNIVKNSPNYEGYESITAQRALKKLLGADHAEIPTAREIELLAKAMPEKASIWRNLLENEEGSLNLPDSSVKRAIINVAGLPRTLKASFDFSAPFRQGMFLVGRKEFWKAMPGMFKSFFSEGKFHEIQEEIRNRPTYDLMNKAGLQITRPDATLAQREEAFVSQFAEKIPGVRHSERAYLAFLNKLRADVFDDFVRKGEALGIDRVQDPHYLKSAARFINAATGRGDIKMVSRNAQLLANVLFSPKLMASRIQLLNPVFYGTLHPAVRKEAAKSGLIYASTVMSILGMAGAAGANVEMDPRSSDFAKIKVHNTRFDVTGGFQPYVRFYAQFLTGQQKGINDDVVRNVGMTFPFIRDRLPGQDQPAFKPTTRKDLVYRFFENKESPNANEVTRLLQESDPVGNPLGSQGSLVPDLVGKATGTKAPNAVNEAVEQFMPLIVSDTYQAYQDLGPTGLLTAIPNAAGVGVSTYTPKKKTPTVDLSDFDIGNSVSMKDFK